MTTDRATMARATKARSTKDRLGQTVAAPSCATGFSLSTLVEAAPLIGANGMRWGPDGRLYVAQAFGGQVSAVEVASGTASVVSPADGAILAPDDLAFDSHGSMYVTEVMSARVSALRPNGKVEVIASEVPVANGVTIHADRIFMSEFNPEGRILELSPNGGAPRVIAANMMMPNALCLGPDNKLYFPLVPLGEVWRVSVDGGAPERVVGDLAIPTAVKFDGLGRLHVVESGTGAILRIDTVTGAKVEVARVAYGIDNFAFAPDGRLFVSHFTDGSVVEISPNGAQREVVCGGMVGPYGMAVRGDGALVVADGMSLGVVDGDGEVERPGMLLQHGFPGYVRGVASAADGSYVTSSSAGLIARYRPGEAAVALLSDLDRAMGVVVAPSDEVIVAEAGTGRVIAIAEGGETRVLASGLADPTGVCLADDGGLYVSEAGAGRVVHIANGHVAVVMDGLREPHGVTLSGGALYALDRGTRQLHRKALGEAAEIVARDLPVGAASGMRLNTLPGIALLMPGPLSPFADITTLADGGIAIGGESDGSLLVLRG